MPSTVTGKNLKREKLWASLRMSLKEYEMKRTQRTLVRVEAYGIMQKYFIHSKNCLL